MLTLATFANSNGVCWPSNSTIATATGISKRTIQRMIPALVSEGELEIITPGRGRGQDRIICLKRYAVDPLNRRTSAKPDKLNAPKLCHVSKRK